jgi:hypothetical protein
MGKRDSLIKFIWRNQKRNQLTAKTSASAAPCASCTWH